MNLEPPTSQKPRRKNALLYSSIVLVCVAFYVAFVLLTRFESNREYARRAAAQKAAEKRAEDRRTFEQLGGSELAIRSLYISPGIIEHGQKAQLCYDVANAKTVTLNPPAGEVWPSHSRCVDLSPQKTTRYTLTIGDASGQTASQSVELQVR